MPRFAKQILRDARRVQKPTHKFYAYRDEIYAGTDECLSLMLANKYVKGRQRLALKFGWLRVRAERYGVWPALMGRR